MSTTWVQHVPRLRDFGAVGSHAGAHHVAIRVALAALVPNVLLVAVNRTEWLPYGLLVVPMSIYGRRAQYRRRLATQAEVGALLTVLVGAGTAVGLTGVPTAWAVLLTGAVAACGALFADLRRWMPAGALFFVFAFAVAATRTGRLADWPVSLAVAGSTYLFTLALTAILSRVDPFARMPEPPPSPTSTAVAVPHACVCLLACVAAESVALLAGLTHPYWAAVSAVVPVAGATTHDQLVRAGQRFAGTVLGVALSAMLFRLDWSTLELVAMFAIAMGVTELFAARNYAIALIFLTPLTIGLALPPQHGSSLGGLLLARLIETSFGVTVAAVCVVATHHSRHPAPAESPEYDLTPEPEPSLVVSPDAGPIYGSSIACGTRKL